MNPKYVDKVVNVDHFGGIAITRSPINRKPLKNNDYWQTPQYILDVINAYWPEGWFDPCPANPEFDGLSAHWGYRKRYLNPPFSQYIDWATYGVCWPGESIWIMDHDHSTERMQVLLEGGCTAICLLKKRVHFVDPATGEPRKNQMRCQSLVYIGARPKDFAYCFRELGFTFLLYDDDEE